MELAPSWGLPTRSWTSWSSGKTLRANNLVAVEEIMPVSGAAGRDPGGAEDRAAPELQPLINAFQSGTKMKIRRLRRVRPVSTRNRGADPLRAAQDARKVSGVVRKIIAAVASGATRRCSCMRGAYERVGPRRWRTWNRRMNEARAGILPAPQVDRCRQAAKRIRSFHRASCRAPGNTPSPNGTQLGQIVTPLERVGIYVPGGKAAYPSSVLMNAIPAKVAGVPEVVMVSPNPNLLVLAAAAIAGVDRVIAIGGAQAVAALAYGTRSVPRVDKIVGPGNAYVAEAKRQVFGQVGIEMIAGPSEILIIGDGTTPADWVAMDLFSQAEHD